MSIALDSSLNVRELVHHGHKVVVEVGAGTEIGFGVVWGEGVGVAPRDVDRGHAA